MALTVTIRSPYAAETLLPDLTFASDCIVFGRAEGCDVWLPDSSLAPRHARVFCQEGSYWLVAEASHVGVVVASHRLAEQTPYALRENETEIHLGPFALVLRVSNMAAVVSQVQNTRELAIALVQQAIAALGNQPEPSVMVRAGCDQGKRLALNPPHIDLMIGRGDDVHLLLDEPDASRRHAYVNRRGDDVWVCDLGSKNGTWLNGERLPPHHETRWPVGAEVRILSDVLVHEDPVANVLLELDQKAAEITAHLAVSEASRAESSVVAPTAPHDANPAAAPARSSGAEVSPIAKIPGSPPRGRPHLLPWFRATLGLGDWAMIGLAIGVVVLGALGLWILFSGQP